MFLAYVGKGYQGMQRNPGAVTIEDELERAIVAAGGISPDNAGDFTKVQWMRAARTDKGVSAVGQSISLRMMLEHPTDKRDVITRINEKLPEGFEFFGYTRVTGGFNAKTMCDRRRYEYVIPTKAFDPRQCRPRAEIEAEATLAAEMGDDDAAAAAAAAAPFVFDEALRDRVAEDSRKLPRHAQLPQLHRSRLPRRAQRDAVHPLVRLFHALRRGRRGVRAVHRRRPVVHVASDSQTRRDDARRRSRRVDRRRPRLRAQDEGIVHRAHGPRTRSFPLRVHIPRL